MRSACCILGQNIDILFGSNGAQLCALWCSTLRVTSRSSLQWRKSDSFQWRESNQCSQCLIPFASSLGHRFISKARKYPHHWLSSLAYLKWFLRARFISDSSCSTWINLNTEVVQDLSKSLLLNTELCLTHFVTVALDIDWIWNLFSSQMFCLITIKQGLSKQWTAERWWLITCNWG